MGAPLITEPQIKVDAPAPDRLGSDSTFETVRISSHPGKIVLATFWATWCAPCMAEMPVLAALQAEVGTDRLQVVAINHREGRRQINRIRRKYDSTGIIFTYDPANRVATQYGVGVIPLTFIIADGKVSAVHEGFGAGGLKAIVDDINALLVHRSSPKRGNIRPRRGH